jgi:Cysteine-rich secretory protein family
MPASYRPSQKLWGLATSVRLIAASACVCIAMAVAYAAPYTFENRSKNQNRAFDGFAPAQGSVASRYFSTEQRQHIVRGGSSHVSGDRLEPLSRQAVVNLYRRDYLAGNVMPPIRWAGDVAACRPGTVDVAYRQSMIDRVNVFRRLARLAPVSLHEATSERHDRTQAAALLMAANDGLSHQPPANWKCFDTAFAGSTVGLFGRDGADRSNLALSSNEEYAGNAVIDAYMTDAGNGNVAVAHRRAVLDPAQTRMAVGVIPASVAPGVHVAAHALGWIDFSTRTGANATPEGVAWPPAGYVPFQLLPSESNRWSFQYPHADFSAATVSIAIDGAPPVAVTAFDFRSGVPDNDPRGAPSCPVGARCVPEDAIVFRPPLDRAGINGVSYTSPGTSDKTYVVAIDGIAGPAGVPQSVRYTVSVLDPTIATDLTAETGANR